MTTSKQTPTHDNDNDAMYKEWAVWDRPLTTVERVALALAYRIHMATPEALRQYSNAWDMGTMLTEPERIFRGKFMLEEAFAITASQIARETLVKCCKAGTKTAAQLEHFVNEVIAEHAAERKKQEAFCAALDALSEEAEYDGPDVYCMTAIKWARCDDAEEAALEIAKRLRKAA